jgi:hypothetical protein
VRELGPTALARAYTGIPFLLGPRTGKAIGSAFESHAKIAHVVDKLGKGWTMESAILSAKKYLFDYGDLTPFEQMYMRRLVPFYTWFRKNTPLQLETLVTKPGKIAVLRHMQQAVEDEPVGSVDTSVLPDWIRRRWHAVNRKDDGAVEFIGGIGLGTEDLAILDFDRTLPDLLSMLNPLVKMTAELALNRDFFRDIPLDRSEYAPSVLRHLPNWFQSHIDFRPVKERSGEVRFYRANPRWLALLRGIPATGALSRVATTAEKFAESERSTYDPLGKFVTGIKRGELGPTKQALNLLYLEREELTEELRVLQREGAARDLQKFIRRTDIAPDDPKARRVREIQRRLGRIGKLAKRARYQLRAGAASAEQEEATGLQRGTRSLGAGR